MDDETQDLSSFGNDCSPPERIASFRLEFNDSNSFQIHELDMYAGQDIIVGRDPSRCQYTILDTRVSKQHFRIYSVIYEAKSEEFPALVYCEDLESINGTYVNDVLIGNIAKERTGWLLCDGDVIEIRPFWKFCFHQANSYRKHFTPMENRDQREFSDRYEILDRLLGKGQYGNVYLATEVATNRQLACKIINLEQAVEHLVVSSFDSEPRSSRQSDTEVTRDQRSKVLREIRILAKLSHPNVIDLKKAFCSEDTLYIFSELSTGGDLYSYMLSRGGTLDDYNARFITKQVALAIQYLHANSIVHRDIKPENVLVSHTYFGGRVVLTDFGFALSVGNVDSTQGDTRAVTRRMMSKLGTYGYAAPEVEAVDEFSIGYTQAADLWSLGILATCMLVGDTAVPQQILSGLSFYSAQARYYGEADQVTRKRWLQMQPRALKFICRLVIMDPESRMIAEEAVSHSWFTKPKGEADALMEGIDRINEFWEKRDPAENTLDCLQGVDKLNTLTSSKSKFKKKRFERVPDTTMSPYFSLDRHLYRRERPVRERILKDLAESRSQFLSSEELSRKLMGESDHRSRNSLELERVNHKKLMKKFPKLPESSTGDNVGMNICDSIGSSMSFSSYKRVTNFDSPDSLQTSANKRSKILTISLSAKRER